MKILQACVQGPRKTRFFHRRIGIGFHVLLELGEKSGGTRQVRDPTTRRVDGQVVGVQQRKAGVSRFEGYFMTVWKAVRQIQIEHI